MQKEQKGKSLIQEIKDETDRDILIDKLHILMPKLTQPQLKEGTDERLSL